MRDFCLAGNEVVRLNSEVMKNIAAGVLLCVVALAASVVYGGQEAPGVVGVDVVVKQIPGKRDMTNAWGVFAFDALPAGSYTLRFKARKANETGGITRDNVIVGTSYSIQIDGTKRPLRQTGLTSDKLIAGIEIPVEVGAGAKIRGLVRPTAKKKMVWIPATPGSNLPGYWTEEGPTPASRLHVETYSSREWQNSSR